MIPAQIRLYTWLDVEQTLRESIESSTEARSWFVEARAYWDGLVVRVLAGRESEARNWLMDLFDPRIRSRGEDLEIILEASSGQERYLPVLIESVGERAAPPAAVPTFGRPSMIYAGTGPLDPPELPSDSPPIFVFHSFKGGVGRTIHALAMAAAITEGRRRALLVDADLEAPGITWLLETRLAAPPIAFSDVLALVHGDPSSDAASTITLVAERLRSAELDKLFVLPAFRSASAFESLEIRPEHLLLSRKDPFVLTTILTRLGRALDVDAIVVDLRAGLSELAAGLLLDPRLYRILVTTLSGQSIHGTRLVLDLLARRAPSRRDWHPVPIVLLNQVPTEFRGSDVLVQAEERLLEALAQTVDKDEEIVARDVLRGPTWFDAGLLALPASWEEALALTRREAIRETIRPLVELVPLRIPQAEEMPAPDLDKRRKALADTAKRFIYAETSGAQEFLPISPLQRLVTDHRTQVPIAVVVGAKGAGKTFTYLQIVRRPTWRDFAEATGQAETSLNALHCPVLQPQNLGGAAQEVRDRRLEAARTLQSGNPLDQIQAADKIRDWLEEPLHESAWRDHWLDLMAWAAGFHVNESGARRQLVEWLASRNQKVVFLFDGIEDLFQELDTSEAQQRGLRALLQDVPNWLEQEPGRWVGTIVFVRRDMVTLAVRQNAGQLLARYDPYALRWDSLEALRLVAWVSGQAGALKLEAKDVRRLTDQELIRHLIPLWARKLGSDQSREGRTAEWVIAALSDFNGQIQARDVVRFLAEAARRSDGNAQWRDRLLVPTAIREAIADCSKAKIEEISTEDRALRRIFDKLRAIPPDQKLIPFTADSVGLDSQELELLKLSGVVVADEGQYYMPEIFRRGLDFRLPRGARPRVLALARRRREGI